MYWKKLLPKLNKIMIIAPNPQKVFILGIGIDKINFSNALKKIDKMILSNTCHQIVTINPEFIVNAQKDKKMG